MPYQRRPAARRLRAAPDQRRSVVMTSTPGSRTATFLFTDIEESTRLWEERRGEMANALQAHDALLRSAVEHAGGTIVKTTGDGLLAVFDRADSALVAAIEGQRSLESHVWPGTGPLKVRMAIHTGTAEARDGDYFGPSLNRVARLLAIGHGGQVLLSGATAIVVADDLPPGSELIDRGEHNLRDIERVEHVFQVAAAGLARDFPPLRSVSPRKTNIPSQATSFVGREREIAEIGRTLEASRLVTLTGVGGTGKTRLGLEMAERLADEQRDGAWLVELAPLADPALVVPGVARTLGVREEPGRPPIDTLVDSLRSKRLLLLLDNCEHLVDAAAELVQVLVRSCPTVTLLATSREPLGVEGEAVFLVPPMALPASIDTADGSDVAAEQLPKAGRAESVRLFVERARSNVPSFALDASNLAAVVEICRRLDGIPLALELAAARVNVLSVAEIAQGLDDRFRLLTGGRRTSVSRQRTLQALIDWSWDLLSDDDRSLLRRLSVFAGGWTLDAAARVTFGRTEDVERPVAGGVRFATLDGLGRLVDRSLVVVDRDATTRYGMLGTIRQYAAERLGSSGETDELRDRHLAHFRRLALDAERGLEGPDMPSWAERVDAEIDNLRAALDRAFEAHPEAALEMCAAMVPYWRSRATASEGSDRMNQAVELARRWLHDSPAPADAARRSVLAARVLARAALIQAAYTGRVAAQALEAEATAISRASGDYTAMAETRVTLVFSRVAADGSIPPAGPEGTIEDALRLAEEIGDWYRVSIIQAAVGMHEAAIDPASAEPWLDRAEASARRTGNPFVLANVAQARGRAASFAGRPTDARRWFEEAARHLSITGDRRFQLVVRSEIAHALRRAGAIDDAEIAYRDTIRGWQHGGNRGAIANQLESFGFIAVARGTDGRAARLLGAAEALREAAEAPMSSAERAEYEDEVRQLRSRLDEAEFNAGMGGGSAPVGRCRGRARRRHVAGTVRRAR